MFDVKESDFFDLEDEAFDTIMEPGIKFTGNIKFVKPFMIRCSVNGKIDATFQKKFVANDPSQRYFTAFRRNISDDKNTPGKNGKMPKANSPRFSGVMEGLFFNPAPSTFIDKQRRELVENEVFFEDKIFDY